MVKRVVIKMWSLVYLSFLVGLAAAGTERGFINFGGFVCPREEKALGKCLKDALNAYIPQLATGLPEFGVPPCEPMVVPSMTIDQATGSIKVTSSYTDVTVRGPSTMKIRDVNVNARKQEVIAKLYIPELKVKGRYKMAGHVLMLPIEGAGRFSGRYGDINAVVTIKLGRAARVTGVDALSCEQLEVDFHVGSANIELEDLFGGKEDLAGAAMNKFINDNWKKLAEELQAPLEMSLRDFLKPLADHAFSTLNADDILTS